ncbi:hypothetical protein DPMN_010956 [Dreissena polymorpha]|uniref:Uncharacterized protein n=1 Tax=Dreissena polymorpha TaxID=45954 RepID=A0A9D4N2Z6_DREPO|nr:hypothetical protein DPMN_010956 [Dreissena polymorpha]
MPRRAVAERVERVVSVLAEAESLVDDVGELSAIRTNKQRSATEGEEDTRPISLGTEEEVPDHVN